MEGARAYKRPGPLWGLWLKIEKFLNLLTTSEYNPFYYLGAVSIFFLWIIFITGIYLFVFYGISASGAYNSVEYLTVHQWYLGGIIRSLHRYASGGLVIAALTHGVRHYVLDRYKHTRWVSWVTGIMMVLIIWIGGIFGYVLVWDERAKFIAIFLSRMIESIPVFGMPLSISFARIENLADQVFYLILAIHFVSIIVVTVLVMIHLGRVARSVINPPKVVAYVLVFVLFLLAFLRPAVSAAPADLRVLPQSVPFDWFYMFVFPLLRYLSERELWLFIAAVILMVSIIPWLTRVRKTPEIEVHKENCTGCELCKEDCPYGAIQMRPRTDGMPYELEAVVIPSRCASCGVCMGACDYRALNFPDLTEEALKNEIGKLSDELMGASRGKKVIVFACAMGAWPDDTIDAGGKVKGFEWARVITLQCIGTLQPSMLDIPFEKGVDGVFIAGCRLGDCSFRRGNEWLAGRINGYRTPVVKKSIDRSRIKTAWLSAVEKGPLLEELGEFHKNLNDKRSV